MDVFSDTPSILWQAAVVTKDNILHATVHNVQWPKAVWVLASLAFVLLIWRLWTFTVRPWLKPHEPRELPYWIPCHAINFFNDWYGVISYGRAYFSENDDPFAISFMGETIYMMTSPEQITAAYKNTTTLSWIEHLDQLLMKFGFQKSSLYKLWQEPCEGDPRYDNPLNPKHKSLGAYTQDLLRQQFLSADKLDDIGGKMLRLVDDSLLLKNLPIDKSGNQVPLPLWDLCARILMDGTTRSWFGNLMHDIEPTFTQLQINCIEEMWKIIMFPYPKFAAKRLHTSLEKARGALLKYIRMPKDVRKEETWLMTKLLDEHKAAGVEDGNIVSVILMMFGVASLNAYGLTFWTLSYILFDEKLLATIRTEISPAFKGATVDYNHIYDNCPRLAAVFKESLRVIFGSVSARQVVAPTVMGTKTLQTGKPVLLVTRHMHSGEEAFGKNADKFEAERFLDNSLDRSKDYKPFGSGATYCPGRVLAKREVLVFVAIMLHRFDIELLDKDGMAKLSPPELDEVVPTLGIKPPVKGTEVYVRLREASRTTEYNE